MSGAYYNDSDRFVCQWLRNLIAADLIAPGDVDERSIKDVKADDLRGYTQCHFFAGIGGWSHALRLAGWPDDRRVWTGSCPCQPFSNIGQRRGFEDERHLWPTWFNLIRESLPPDIFGEQVATASVWFDEVFSNLEAAGYAVGAADIPAIAVNAQHTRKRLWFVASNPHEAGRENLERLPTPEEEADIRSPLGLVHGTQVTHLPGTLIPDQSWIVDGLSGEGHAVGTYGNAIVPQVAAEFIGAYLDTLSEAV